MSNAPERIWAWCLNKAEFGGWDKWGGYARATNMRAMDETERDTGAEYVRADLHRDLALDVIAAGGQASDAYDAQLKAEAMAEKLAAAIRDMGHTATDEAVSALAEYEASK